MVQCRQLPLMKLKDKEGRSRINLPLKIIFGFLPEEIIIEKVAGINNAIRVLAVLTKEELENEKKNSRIVVNREKDEGSTVKSKRKKENGR